MGEKTVACFYAFMHVSYFSAFIYYKHESTKCDVFMYFVPRYDIIGEK